jgi:hypothetical protein
VAREALRQESHEIVVTLPYKKELSDLELPPSPQTKNGRRKLKFIFMAGPRGRDNVT